MEMFQRKQNRKHSFSHFHLQIYDIHLWINISSILLLNFYSIFFFSFRWMSFLQKQQRKMIGIIFKNLSCIFLQRSLGLKDEKCKLTLVNSVVSYIHCIVHFSIGHVHKTKQLNYLQWTLKFCFYFPHILPRSALHFFLRKFCGKSQFFIPKKPTMFFSLYWQCCDLTIYIVRLALVEVWD